MTERGISQRLALSSLLPGHGVDSYWKCVLYTNLPRTDTENFLQPDCTFTGIEYISVHYLKGIGRDILYSIDLN